MGRDVRTRFMKFECIKRCSFRVSERMGQKILDRAGAHPRPFLAPSLLTVHSVTVGRYRNFCFVSESSAFLVSPLWGSNFGQ